MEKILCIVAHPDDEVLGCGGMIANLSRQNEIYTLILGAGITSRDIPKKNKQKDLRELKKDAFNANNLLGIKEVFLEDFPDNKFDSIPLLNIIKVVESKIHKIKPKVILTHHHGDLNIDHKITFEAVLTASRPLENCSVKKILTFEVLSSTEWNVQNQTNVFIPNTYFDISKTINLKIKSMKCYRSEIKEYHHPRSKEGIKILARKRGLEVGFNYAEAFNLVRAIVG